MRATGVTAELRHGYHTAVTLGDWVIEPEARTGFVFSAPVLARHEPWASREALDLATALGPVEWVWRGMVPEWAGDRLRVVIGARRPDEVRDLPQGGVPGAPG